MRTLVGLIFAQCFDMPDPEKQPATLIRVASDMEAAMIVGAMEDEQSDATLTGEFTAGFRAEAPGQISVLVRQSDLRRAREALAKLQGHPPQAPLQSQTTSIASLLAVIMLLTVGVAFILSVF